MGSGRNSIDLIVHAPQNSPQNSGVLMASGSRYVPGESLFLQGVVVGTDPDLVEVGLQVPPNIEDLVGEAYSVSEEHGYAGLGDNKATEYVRTRMPASEYEIHAGKWQRAGAPEEFVFVATIDPIPILLVLGAVAVGACMVLRVIESRERSKFVRECYSRGGMPRVSVRGSLETSVEGEHRTVRVGCNADWHMECARPS